jgi:hypothetical protein
VNAADSLNITKGTVSTVTMNSGIGIAASESAAENVNNWYIYTQEGEQVWRVWDREASRWNPRYVPPGTYQVRVTYHGVSGQTTLAEGLEVKAGQIVEIDLE